MASATLEQMKWQDLAFFGFAGGVLLTLVWAGAFTPAMLQRGPKRDVGMGANDVAAAFGAYVFGILLASLGVSAYLAHYGAEEFEDLSPSQTGVFSLIAPFLIFGPGIAFLIWRLSRDGNLRLGGVVPRHPLRDVWVALVATVIAFVFAAVVALAATVVYELLGNTKPDHGHVVFETLAQNDSASLLMMLAISAVVLAPLTEEFFFRGLMQTAIVSTLGHEKRWAGIFITATFFGVVHYGSVPAVMIPALIVLGVIFGWVYERTGSIWCAVGVHAGFNGLSMMLQLGQSAG